MTIMDPQRLLATFLELVQIDSPTDHEAGVAEYCRGVLEAFGCQVTIDDTAHLTGSNTGNLIAQLKGDVPGKLFFSAHMDTVSPGQGVKPVVEDGIIRAASDTILGSDDKVGIAAIIEMIRVLSADATVHPTIVVLLTVGEEASLKGAKVMDDSLFSGEPCFVLDSENQPGEVVIGAPYHSSYTATFLGRAAHAGVSPEKGISAIVLAAKAIAAMPQSRLDEVTTANVGTIHGGAANNIVSDNCVVTGEFRSLRQQRLEEVKADIAAAFNGAVSGSEGSVEVVWGDNYPGFLLDANDSVVQLALRAGEKLGLPARTVVTGGGSDTNVFADKGLHAVTLGTGMKEIHGLDEYLAVVDLESLCRLIIQITEDHRPS